MAEISVNTQDGALRAVRCLQSVSKHCCWKLLKSCDFFHPSTLQGAEEEVETKNKNKKSAVDPSRKRKGDDFPQQERRRRDAAETAAGSGTKRRNREQSSAKARRGEERRLCALRRGEGRGGEGRGGARHTTPLSAQLPVSKRALSVPPSSRWTLIRSDLLPARLPACTREI